MSFGQVCIDLYCTQPQPFFSVFLWLSWVSFLLRFFLVHPFVSGSIYFLWIPHLYVKFTSTNYSTWAFQFELFLKGKDLWGHIDDMDVEKPSTFDKS